MSVAPAHARRGLEGWIAVLSACRHLSPWPDGLAASTVFRSLVRGLKDECAIQLRLPQRTTGPGRFLRELAHDLPGRASGLARGLEGEDRGALDRVLADFCGAIRSASETVPGVLRRRGEWIRRGTAAEYGVVHPGIGRHLRDVTIEIVPVDGVPAGAPAGWLASGITRPGIGNRREVVVRLAVGAKWESWAAVPYLLAHETVIHAAQGPWGTTWEPPGEYDEFAEGWMDVVALAIHDSLVLGMGHEPALEHADDNRRAAAAYHLTRRQLSLERRGTRQRLLGMETAERFREYLRLTGDEVAARFVAVSLAINASSLSNLERRRTVWSLDTLLGAPGSPPGSAPGAARIEAWLAEWEESGTIAPLEL